jgi:hypothetical protein
MGIKRLSALGLLIMVMMAAPAVRDEDTRRAATEGAAR